MSAQTARSMDTPIMDASNAVWILSLGGIVIAGTVQLHTYGISTNSL